MNEHCSYRERFGNQSVATDMMCSRDNPCHIDVNGDGAIAGLGDDDEDETGNALAIVPHDARPDLLVSQRAVVHARDLRLATSSTHTNTVTCTSRVSNMLQQRAHFF